MKITGCLQYEYFYNQFWRKCEMEIVDIAPHLAAVATFAVHQIGNGQWQITNVETGGAVRQSKGIDRRESLQLARQTLAAMTVSDIANSYRKAFKASTLLRREARRK